jgi:hypothetical protein
MMPSPTRTVGRPQFSQALGMILEKGPRSKTLSKLQLYNIADLIENSNPSHVAAFLYPFFLHCPFVKHDICSAGSFTLAQAVYLYEEALKTFSAEALTQRELESLVDEFKELIYAKGTPLGYANKPKEAAIKGISDGFVYPFIY